MRTVLRRSGARTSMPEGWAYAQVMCGQGSDRGWVEPGLVKAWGRLSGGGWRVRGEVVLSRAAGQRRDGVGACCTEECKCAVRREGKVERLNARGAHDALLCRYLGAASVAPSAWLQAGYSMQAGDMHAALQG